MANLTAARRAKMPKSSFAGPGKSFPINDPTHARLAIGGATRSERAGNISAGTADRIKAEARAKLRGGRGEPTRGDGTNPGNKRPNDNSAGRAMARRPTMAIAGISGNRGEGETRAKASASAADAANDFEVGQTSQMASNRTQRAPSASAGRVGARDGMGSGKGGFALHSSMSDANADGYERDHTSRTR